MLTAAIIVVILALGLIFYRDWGDNKPGILTKVKLLITHIQVQSHSFATMRVVPTQVVSLPRKGCRKVQRCNGELAEVCSGDVIITQDSM